MLSWSILQSFWPALSNNWSWKPIFGLLFEWPLSKGFTVFPSKRLLVACWYSLQANRTQIRNYKTSILIRIQFIWPSGSVPERIFEKKMFWKKSTDDNKACGPNISVSWCRPNICVSWCGPNICVSWSTSELRVRLAPLNRFKPSSKIIYWPFQDGTSFVDLLCVFFCLVFASLCARLFICALWSPAVKGLTSCLWCLTVNLSLSHWYPESGVALDCIDSWSLHPYLLWKIIQYANTSK